MGSTSGTKKEKYKRPDKVYDEGSYLDDEVFDFRFLDFHNKPLTPI